MSTKKVMELLTLPDRGASEPSGPNGILARLFRIILWQLNITPMRFGKYMSDYIHDKRYGIKDTRTAHTMARGNLMKELGKSEMTFKVFMKGLRFIKISRIEFIIKAHHPNGTTTVHSTEVDLSSEEMTASFMDDAEEENVKGNKDATD
jgi:hypothetical protein